jgi:hypothetical protein
MTLSNRLRLRQNIRNERCKRSVYTHLEIRTKTKLFCEDRVFISAASPVFLLTWATLFVDFLRGPSSEGVGVGDRDPCRRPSVERVRCRRGAEGGASEAAERRSVNEREALSLMGGARVGADNNRVLAAWDRGESSGRSKVGVPSAELSALGCGVSSTVIDFRSLRAGHTYSMIRRPTLASI